MKIFEGTRGDVAIAIILTALGGAVRVWFWPEGLGHHDAVQTALAVRHWLDSGELVGQTFGRLGSVLHAVMWLELDLLFGLSQLLGSFDRAEFAVLAADLAAGALWAPAAYWLLREGRWERTTSLIISACLACHHGAILSSSLGKEHGQEVLCLLLCWAAGLRWARTAQWFWFVASVCFAVAALAVRESAIVFLPATVVAVVVARHGWTTRAVKSALLWICSTAMLTSCALGWYLVPYLQRWLAEPLPHGHVALRLHNVFPEVVDDIVLSMTPLGLLLLVAGSVSCRFASGRDLFRLLILAAGTLASAIVLSPYRYRYFLPSHLAFYLLAAVGLERLRKLTRFAPALCAAGLIVTQISVLYLSLLRSGGGDASVREWARVVESRLPIGAVVIACDYSGFLRYYTRLEVETQCDWTNLGMESMRDRLRHAEVRGLQVYLTGSAFNYDKEHLGLSNLRREYRLEPIIVLPHRAVNGDGLRLYSYPEVIWRLLPLESHQL